jgi:hypothetical protein
LALFQGIVLFQGKQIGTQVSWPAVAGERYTEESDLFFAILAKIVFQFLLSEKHVRDVINKHMLSRCRMILNYWLY